MSLRGLALLPLGFLSLMDAGRAGTLDAITFAAEPGKLFIPVNEAADQLGWQIARDDQGQTFQPNASDVPLPPRNWPPQEPQSRTCKRERGEGPQAAHFAKCVRMASTRPGMV